VQFPEYTVSLLIWVLPDVAIGIFVFGKRLLSVEKVYAFLLTVGVLAAIGCGLDLLFASRFFTFPEPRSVLGWHPGGVPFEEYVFYISGFWFILFLYVFCDEWYLKAYNLPDEWYARFRRRLDRLVYPHWRGVAWLGGLALLSVAAKVFLNPGHGWLPGYFLFLLLMAYGPFVLFYRVTRRFVNWRGFIVTVLVTTLLSVIWEVTLALPRGYWNYQHPSMLGIFIGVWHDLPIEAVTVWGSSTLVILIYEFVKIRYFTPAPTTPWHKALKKLGYDWREGQSGLSGSAEGSAPAKKDSGPATG